MDNTIKTMGNQPRKAGKVQRMMITTALGLSLINPIPLISYLPDMHLHAIQGPQAIEKQEIVHPNPYEVNKEIRRVVKKIVKSTKPKSEYVYQRYGYRELKIMKRIAEVIDERIEYSSEAGGKYGCKRAFEAWETRKGDCNEMSYLFIGMLKEAQRLLAKEKEYLGSTILAVQPVEVSLLAEGWDHMCVGVVLKKAIDWELMSYEFENDSDLRKRILAKLDIEDEKGMCLLLIDPTAELKDQFGIPHYKFKVLTDIENKKVFYIDSKFYYSDMAREKEEKIYRNILSMDPKDLGVRYALFKLYAEDIEERIKSGHTKRIPEKLRQAMSEAKNILDLKSSAVTQVFLVTPIVTGIYNTLQKINALAMITNMESLQNVLDSKDLEFLLNFNKSILNGESVFSSYTEYMRRRKLKKKKERMLKKKLRYYKKQAQQIIEMEDEILSFLDLLASYANRLSEEEVENLEESIKKIIKNLRNGKVKEMIKKIIAVNIKLYNSYRFQEGIED